MFHILCKLFYRFSQIDVWNSAFTNWDVTYKRKIRQTLGHFCLLLRKMGLFWLVDLKDLILIIQKKRCNYIKTFSLCSEKLREINKQLHVLLFIYYDVKFTGNTLRNPSIPRICVWYRSTISKINRNTKFVEVCSQDYII